LDLDIVRYGTRRLRDPDWHPSFGAAQSGLVAAEIEEVDALAPKRVESDKD
jgi:hypothetical protein